MTMGLMYRDQHNDKIYVASDSMVTAMADNARFVLPRSKICTLSSSDGNDIVCIASGTVALSNILRNNDFIFEPFVPGNDFERQLHRYFIPRLLELQREYEFDLEMAESGDDRRRWVTLIGSMVIAYGTQIFEIDETRSIIAKPHWGLTGSSAIFAYPAMITAEYFTEDAQEIVRATVRAAMRVDPFVAPPVHFATYSGCKLGPISIMDLRDPCCPTG